jgi:hypothetical protein
MKSMLRIQIGLYLPMLLMLSTGWCATPQYRAVDISAKLDQTIQLEGVNLPGRSTALLVNDQGHIAGNYGASLTASSMRDITRTKAFIYRPESGVEWIYGPDASWNILVKDMNGKDDLITEWYQRSGRWGDGYAHSIHVRLHGEDMELPISAKNLNDNREVAGIRSRKVDDTTTDLKGITVVGNGTSRRSVAIWKEGQPLIDLFENVDDCDQTVAGDCDGANRIDFDHWQGIESIDINNQGQVVFLLERKDGDRPHAAYLYTPGEGVKQLIFQELATRYISVQINNTGKITYLAESSEAGPPCISDIELFSSNGQNISVGTVAENPVGGGADALSQAHQCSYDSSFVLGDSDVLVGSRFALFSLTDISQTLEKSVFSGLVSGASRTKLSDIPMTL